MIYVQGKKKKSFLTFLCTFPHHAQYLFDKQISTAKTIIDMSDTKASPY